MADANSTSSKFTEDELKSINANICEIADIFQGLKALLTDSKDHEPHYTNEGIPVQLTMDCLIERGIVHSKHSMRLFDELDRMELRKS